MDSSMLRLARNALFPWFVIIPRTTEIEFYRLDTQHQGMLLEQISLISRFVEETFEIEKLNVATIGNIVSQMHIHVVGRRHDDPCWPGVVWGCEHFRPYEDDDVSAIRQKLLDRSLITV